MILGSVYEPAFSLADILFLASFAGNAINNVRALTGHIAFRCVLPLCDTRCDLFASVDVCAISAMDCCAYIGCVAPYGCINLRPWDLKNTGERLIALLNQCRRAILPVNVAIPLTAPSREDIMYQGPGGCIVGKYNVTKKRLSTERGFSMIVWKAADNCDVTMVATLRLRDMTIQHVGHQGARLAASSQGSVFSLPW